MTIFSPRCLKLMTQRRFKKIKESKHPKSFIWLASFWWTWSRYCSFFFWWYQILTLLWIARSFSQSFSSDTHPEKIVRMIESCYSQHFFFLCFSVHPKKMDLEGLPFFAGMAVYCYEVQSCIMYLKAFHFACQLVKNGS